MKKEICNELPFCNRCEADAQFGCPGCDNDVCVDHRELDFELYFKSFSLDPSSYYPVCKECDKNPPKEIKVMLAFVKKVSKKITAELARRQKKMEEIHAFAEENFPKD